jgi:hypothetical protein
MPLEKERVVSAQVVLRPASGKTIDGKTLITSDNIRDFVPSPEAVARATSAFAAAGFEVGNVVGISFSISATVDTFEHVFETRLRRSERGGIEAVRDDGAGNYELPLKALPQSLANLIVAVTFMRPPDFGPTEFFGP